MSEQPTVADYIVRRLSREGITDCFGVAGDFAFKLLGAVARSEAVRWIGCSNELDAALARAATGESASYIEVVGGRMDFPAGLAMAHQRLDALYGNG